MLNGLEAVKAAAIGELSEPHRLAAVELLDRTGAESDIARQVRALLADETGLPTPRLNRFERAGRAIPDGTCGSRHDAGTRARSPGGS